MIRVHTCLKQGSFSVNPLLQFLACRFWLSGSQVRLPNSNSVRDAASNQFVLATIPITGRCLEAKQYYTMLKFNIVHQSHNIFQAGTCKHHNTTESNNI